MPAYGPPAAPRPRTVIVENPSDHASITRHLAATGGLAAGRAIIRPTPGAADLCTLGLDVLVAAGISTEAAQKEHLRGVCWEYARAWLTGHRVTDLLADRAHRLTAAQLTALGGLAADLGASLWLLWGSSADPAPAIAELRNVVGREVERIGMWDLCGQLEPVERKPVGLPEADGWPPLPEADFITFLAACRRHLAAPDFAAVASAYYDAADMTDLWTELRRDLPARSMACFTAVLTSWLRDDMLGPAPCAAVALVRLRAVQAALLTRGILLRWDATALGPDPAARLTGDLTPGRATMLAMACGQTGMAAATALCLHLNHRATHLGHLAISDIAPDGSALTLDPARWQLAGGQAGSRDGTALAELAYGDLVRLPACAQPIIAAHLAYRRGQGADEGDPYFIGSRSPDRGSPERTLNNAVSRACRTIGYDPPWLHGNDCRYGADTGLTAREPGWLAERGLSLHRIDPAISDCVPPPVSPRRYRPASLERPDMPRRPQHPPGRTLYQERIAASGLSAWELGNLLGIHPHLLAGPALGDQPTRLLVELARILQIHPAELYADLETVLTYKRADHGPRARRSDNSPANERAGDAVTMLTALAYARAPLGPGDLSRALGWPLQRVTAALQHAARNPSTGGALALRRVPPETYTAVPRPDTLTASQRHALTSVARSRDLLNPSEAAVLLAALAFGEASDYASFREDHQHAEHILKQTGLVHSNHGPHHARVSKDVMFSLRYCDDQHIVDEGTQAGPIH